LARRARRWVGARGSAAGRRGFPPGQASFELREPGHQAIERHERGPQREPGQQHFQGSSGLGGSRHVVEALREALLQAYQVARVTIGRQLPDPASLIVRQIEQLVLVHAQLRHDQVAKKAEQIARHDR
jgi:hypothetical protein